LDLIQPLNEALMHDNFDRRDSELTYEEFKWHESRKFNKASIDKTKFDIGMVSLEKTLSDHKRYQKIEKRKIKAVVTNSERAFDFPAHYWIDDNETPEVISFTHTYTGQAQQGELIEVSGMVERNIDNGKCRLIVGSTREAKGEYIKVVR
jgi:predicted nucleotidyltransferase